MRTTNVHRPFRRALAGVLSLAVAAGPTTSLAVESRAFWEERRAVLSRAAVPVESASLLAQWPNERPTWTLGGSETTGSTAAWARLGRGAARLTSFRPAARAGAPIVLLVQDLHDVAEAQKNISALLQELGLHGGVELVALEGSTGDFVLEPIRRFAPPDVLASLATGLLERNLIGGPEHAGLSAPRPLRLFGAEDPVLYQENLAAARAALARQAELKAALAPARRALAEAHARHDTPAQHAHYLKAAARADGRLSLPDYAVHLLSRPGAATVAAPNLRKLADVFRREKALDFNAVEAERTAFLTDLGRRLSGDETADLLRRALEHRAGRIGYAALFDHLDGIARRHGLSLAAHPALSAYRAYAQRTESIERAGVLTELDVLERAVEDALARGVTARAVLALDRESRLLTRLVDLSLSPDGWRAYRAVRENLQRWPEAWDRLGLSKRAFPSESAFRPFEHFCELAIRRNNALASRALGRAAAERSKVVALVAGGFHTPGLESALLRQGAAVGVYTPRVDRAPDGPGLAGLIDDPRPLEKLFAGEPISLVSERALSPAPISDVARQRAVEGVLAAGPVAVGLSEGALDRSSADASLGRLASEALATVETARVEGPRGGPYAVRLEGGGRATSLSVSVDPRAAPGDSVFPVSKEGRSTSVVFDAAPERPILDILEPWSRLSTFRQKLPTLYYGLVGLWETAAFRYVGLTLLPAILLDADVPLWVAVSAGFLWAVPFFVFAHTLVRWAFHAPEEGWTLAAFAREWRAEWVPSRKQFLGSRPLLALALTGLYAALALMPVPEAWAVALFGTAVAHGDWDHSIHRHRSDPVDSQEYGEARVRRSLRRPVELARKWFMSGDFDKLGAKNELLGKDTIGDLFEWIQGPDVVFLKRSLFRESREVVARAARLAGGRVHRGVGGDELIFEFEGTEARARRFLEDVIGGVDRHFRGKYAFFAIHRESLLVSELEALKALPGAIVLTRYGAGYRLVVERRPGRWPRVGEALRRWTGRPSAAERSFDTILDEIQSVMYRLTDISPLVFERADRGPFTLSIGAVNAEDVLSVLRDTAGEADEAWRLGRGWRAGRRRDLIEWGYRFANDALNRAKEEGRNRAVLLAGPDAIRSAIPEGRVTKEKIGQLRAEADRAARAEVSNGRDHLTGWRTPAEFRARQRRLRTRVGPFLHHFFISSYRGDRRLERRGFHETQSLPNVGHQGGNALIAANFAFADRLFALDGEPARDRGARAPPDSAFVAARNDLLSTPGVDPAAVRREWDRYRASLPAEIAANAPYEIQPTFFVITVDERRLRNQSAVPASSYFVAEMMAKSVGELLSRHQEQAPAVWLTALKSIGDLRAHFVGEDGPRVLQLSFAPDKAGPLTGVYRRAQEAGSRRAHAELTSQPMPRVVVSESAGLIDQWAEARPAEPKDPAGGLREVLPVLRPLGVDAALRDTAPALRVAAGVRRAYAHWWSHRLSETAVVLDRPAVERQAGRWSERVIDPAPGRLAEAGVAARATGDGPALILDAAQRLQSVPRPRASLAAALRWAEGLADRTALAWFAGPEGGSGVERAQTVKTLVAAAGLASTGSNGFDADRFARLAERLETRLNENLRELSRVESEGERFRVAAAEGRDIVIDATDAGNRAAALARAVGKAAEAFRRAPESPSRLVFIDRAPGGSDEALERTVADLLRAAKLTRAADVARVRRFANTPARARLFEGGRVRLKTLGEALRVRPSDATRPMDVHTPDAAAWDATGMEDLVRLLVHLAGDLVYNATERLDEALRTTIFVSINA